MPEKVFKQAEENYSRGDHKGFSCYFTVGLHENEWNILVSLQNKFGNLSNESVTIITTLNELVETRFPISWGHDQALKKFFLDKGLENAKNLNIIPGITMEYIGQPTLTYKEYLEQSDFLKKPEGW